MTQPIISNKWFMTAPLKAHLSEDESPETVLKVANIFSKETARLAKKVAKSTLLTEYEAYSMSEKLEDISGDFEFVVKLLDGTIKKDDWPNYAYSGDYLAEFNGVLSSLYDVGDERVLTKNNHTYKFLILTH